MLRVEPCRFEGQIGLAEPGRWMVAARFTYDDREAEVVMPVGVADTTETFERGDCRHAMAAEESGWDVTQMMLLAGLGAGNWGGVDAGVTLLACAASGCGHCWPEPVACAMNWRFCVASRLRRRVPE